jgi:short-subunit dehydrogenase
MPKALITGISKGIGLATARRFAREGYTVTGCASSRESIEALQASDPELVCHQADLSKKTEAQAFGARMAEQYGAFDVVINNAGRFVPGEVHKEPDEVFEELMALNMAATYYLTKQVLAPMIEARAGTIVNVCSTASIKAYPNGGAYGISKAAQYSFSKVLREEMKQYNIRVIAILPGPTNTASWEGADIPPERFQQPEDIAEMIWQSCQLPAATVVEDVVMRPFYGDID